MAPKAAPAAPIQRQDLPWAMGILGNPEADPTQLPLALNYLTTFNVASQLPHDVAAAAQLITLVTPFVCATEAAVTSAALKALTRLVFAEPQNHEELREALRQTACLQALWAVLAYFHASFDAYAARWTAIQSEPPEPPPPPTRTGKPDSRLSKAPPPPPVDPETTLPGPSKYALDAALSALTHIVGGGGPPAAEAATGVMCGDVAPVLTVLRHHSSRIQVLGLRLLRTLLRSEALAVVLAAAGAVSRLSGMLVSSPHGIVREEVLLGLERLMGKYPPSMLLGLEADLPTRLLRHILAPTTGVPTEGAPPPVLPARGSDAGASPRAAPTSPRGAPPSPKAAMTSPKPSATGDGADPRPATPQGPPPIDFVKPMVSSPDRLQELSVHLLLQLCKHHNGAVHHLLQLGAMQLLLALLPSPKLPDLPQPSVPDSTDNSPRPMSASDVTISDAIGRAGASLTADGATPPRLPPLPIENYLVPYLDGPPTLPLPASKLSSPQLCASLLQLLSCFLSEPKVQDFWWSVQGTRRLHLQLMYLLRADAPPKPKPPEAPTPSRRLTPAQAAALAAAAAQPASPPPPDHMLPPFPPEIRAAALHCVLQLVKDLRWLQLSPYLSQLQQTVRQTEDWVPEMVAPLAEILQRIMQVRLPPPARAVAAAAGAAAAIPPAAAMTPSASPRIPPLPTGESPPPALLPDQLRSCNAVSNGLSPVANGLSEVELSSDDAVTALKELAKMARKPSNNDPRAISAVAAALLVLPESAIYAPPWPPLPSPPPTPPPPPLPTTQYLWDALGRPVMTDGIKLAHL